MFFNGKMPFQTADTFIAPNASVIGDVTNWDRSSVWYNAVVRADSHSIEIGYCSSVGEGSVVCTLPAGQMLKTGFSPEVFIGHYVTIGAGCVLKSCRIDDCVTIGDKCTVMEGAIVENNTKLESGTVVPAYGRIPSGQVWGGNPASYVRDLTAGELDVNKVKTSCKAIHQIAYDHMVEFLPVGSTYLHLEELEKKGVQATEG
jgi:gamma-carbonic anhydrase